MASAPEIQSLPMDDVTDTSVTPESELSGQIDLRELLENCLGMPTFAVSLLAEFARTAPGRIEGFEARFQEANLPAVSELAHALKGVAGVLGAQSLRAATIAMEAACRDDDLQLTAELLHTVRTGIQRIQQDIPKISASLLGDTHDR